MAQVETTPTVHDSSASALAGVEEPFNQAFSSKNKTLWGERVVPAFVIAVVINSLYFLLVSSQRPLTILFSFVAILSGFIFVPTLALKELEEKDPQINEYQQGAPNKEKLDGEERKLSGSSSEEIYATVQNWAMAVENELEKWSLAMHNLVKKLAAVVEPVLNAFSEQSFKMPEAEEAVSEESFEMAYIDDLKKQMMEMYDEFAIVEANHAKELKKLEDKLEIHDLESRLSATSSLAEFYRSQAQQNEEMWKKLEEEKNDLMMELCAANASSEEDYVCI